MAKIFDREDEPNDFMEMPCRCDCGKWFDLNDGHGSERHKNKVICGECYETEEKEIQREEEIQEWKNLLENAKVDIKSAERELKRLGIESDTPTHDLTDIEREAEKLYPFNPVKGWSDAMNASYESISKYKRAAHISCAKQFIDKVKGLEAENAELRRQLQSVKEEHDFINKPLI